MLSHNIVFLHLLPLISTTLLPFDKWNHGRVQLDDVSIHFRYAGSGPPVLLVHGNPQYSLTWSQVGPTLAEKYTVIAPDNRGAGDSSLPRAENYTSKTQGADLKGVLDFLNISQALVFSHDKGCGPATSLAIEHPTLVKALGVSEYPLPGFGYEKSWTPEPNWSLYQNLQLAFFSVPDAAEFFIRGREKEMLSWYFYHASYSGPESVPTDILNRYTNSIAKPGFLRALFQPFSVDTVYADRAYFKGTLRNNPLEMPILALGGEASLAPASTLRELWDPVGRNVMVDVVPKAGHWLADENPDWVAQRLLTFFGPYAASVPAVDLSWLDNRVTLNGVLSAP